MCSLTDFFFNRNTHFYCFCVSYFHTVTFGFSFPLTESPFSIFCWAGLVVTNSFSFCLSVKLFISPSILNVSLARWVFLTAHFSYSVLWIYPTSPFWLGEFSAEKWADSLMGFLLQVTVFFCLAAFKFFSLLLHFVSLVTFFGVSLLLLTLMGLLCASWIWIAVSFPR